MSAAEPSDVTIVIVSYNTRELTLACLDSVAAETQSTRFHVRVVDNASQDGSVADLRAHTIGADVIASSENLGFARASNLAVAGSASEFILLLNPDTVVIDRAIDRLVTFARANPQAGIWGGRTLFADRNLNPSSCWGRMTPWNLLCRATGLTGLFANTTVFNGEAYGGWQRDSVRSVAIVSGCFLLIRRSLWDQLGGFDQAFFMYGEEADLCLRARKRGARPMITPSATIIHYGGASERTRTGKMNKLLTAKMTLIRRHWHPLLVPVGVALMAAWPLSRWLVHAARSTITADPTSLATAASWREIWRSRSSWRPGYGLPATIDAEQIFSSTAR